MQPRFYKQPWIFRRKTWAKIRVKISQCTVHVGAWRVWPHQLFSLCLSSPGTALLVQQHSHTAGNYKMELQHLTVCCISLSLHTLFIGALPLGHLSVLIPPRKLRFHNHFITILCCRIFPILNQSYWISCRGKLKNIHIVILDHLYILIFLSEPDFLLQYSPKHQSDSSKWCGLYAVWKWCSPLLIPAAAASCCSCHSVLVPTRRAAKGITPTPRHVGLTLTLLLAHGKFCGCPSAPGGGSNARANMAHSSYGEYPDKITKIANLFSSINQMFPALLS